MNVRANIMYFLEHFLDLAQKEGHTEYVRMVQRDIIRVVDAVAPDDGSGAANVKVVRKVLQGLQNKSFLEAQAVTDIEEVLKERETAAHDITMSSPPAGGGDAGGPEANGSDDLSDMPPSQTLPHPSGHSQSRRNPQQSGPRLDRKQVEQRIEEDRERHKRLRESIWAIPSGPNAERDKLWEETSDLGDDDHFLGQEEYDERLKSIQMSCPHRQAEAGAANGGNTNH
jgi:CTD kinase subunit gamma